MSFRKNTDGTVRVAALKPDSSKTTVCSHDWTDPTTWSTDAVRVVAEAAERTGAGVYQLAHVNAIDVLHGKITNEDWLLDADGNSYRVVVTVDGAAKTERDPHVGSGGDFTLDYATGVLTLAADPGEGADVRVTYHYATTSRMVLRPDAGKVLSIGLVEVQFSDDIVITDSVNFQGYGYVDVFAPQMLGEPYNIPSGTKIPLGDPMRYKGMRDFVNDAVRAYPGYPVLGGDGWRGLPRPIYVFDWDYVSATPLSSAAGMEIEVRLQHDVPFGGSFATATFYCTSEDE